MSEATTGALIGAVALIVVTLIPVLSKHSERKAKRRATEPSLAGISNDIITALYKQIAYFEAQVEDMRRDLTNAHAREREHYIADRRKDRTIADLETKLGRMADTIEDLRDFVAQAGLTLPPELQGLGNAAGQ